MDGNVNLFDWYWEMPIVTRLYFTGSFVLTVLCALDMGVSPLHLYFNWRLISLGEYWRLLSNFMYFGNWGIDFLFNMYFLVRYSRSLEEGSFRGRPADFLMCLLFGMALLLSIAHLTEVMFFGASLTFMMVYIWSKRNPGMQISLMGLIAFTAPYLPWALLGFSMLLEHNITADVLGICVGHLYYFFADVWPALAAARGWRWRRVMRTPWLLHVLFNTHRQPPPAIEIVAPPAAPALAGGGAAAAAAAAAAAGDER